MMELVPFKETWEGLPSLCAQRGHANTRQEGTHPQSQEKRSQDEVYIAGTLILDFADFSMWKINFCSLSHPACSIWLQQPKLTNTAASPTWVLELAALIPT